MTAAAIAAVEGEAVAALLADAVARWRPALRLAGVLAEGHGLADRACNAGYLRSIVSGARFAMFRDTVASPDACHLDGAGVLAASAAVERDVAAGCDLVVLNKFGRLEAAGKGLAGAFAAAKAAGVPILTSVSPASRAAWARFAGDWAVLPADIAALGAWCAAAGITGASAAPRRAAGGRPPSIPAGARPGGR